MFDPIDIIIPVYKNVELVEACINSVKSNLPEISMCDPRIIVINDSPDDEAVTTFLSRLKERGDIDVLITNLRNLGFVKSVNSALEMAKSRRSSAILVNSDTITFPGTLKELVAVSQIDEQIGFVCPRSNNASICTFPQTPHARAGLTISASECYSSWTDVKQYLPRYSFAPTAVGFYMLIKRQILENFGGLDEVFDVGYEEENDLVMRANKVGFLAALANHAYAYHAGSASFLLQDMDLDGHRNSNLKKMVARHPEFIPSVSKYQASPEYRAETMMRTLVPDARGRVKVVLNLRNMTPIFNGTNELILNVLKSLDQLNHDAFEIDILVRPNISEFYDLERLRHLRCTDEIRPIYGIAVSFGQPYDLDVTNVMEMLAPINVFGMLDAISYDCAYLRVSQNMEHLWQNAASTANGLFYISRFSEKTFKNRFSVSPLGKSYARLLPTKKSSYQDRYLGTPRGASHVFVAGNHYDHKDSTRTALQLSAAFQSTQFVVLGGEGEDRPNLRRVRSGNVSDEEMIKILADSSVVVMPSYYEGFGFSVMHALALKKPIVVRDIPVTREIMATFKSVSGVVFFSGNDELPDAVKASLAFHESEVDDADAEDWNIWTLGLVDFLKGLLDNKSVLPLLKARIVSGDIMRKLHDYDKRVTPNAAASGRMRPKSRTRGGKTRYAFSGLRQLDDQDFVQFLYEGLLGREPDRTGYEHHLESLVSGTSRKQIIKAFITSPEYQKSGRNVAISGLWTSFLWNQ